jgi:hypothetical protein
MSGGLWGKIREMGAIVEEFVEGTMKRSPSVHARIDPLGQIEALWTHDQVLGGRPIRCFGAGFATFPPARYSEEGLKAAGSCGIEGSGRFGIDFLSVWDGGRWRHRAIEINLRG